MSLSTSIVHSDTHTHVSCSLGALHRVVGHLGLDGVRYTELYFDRAKMLMPSAALAELIRQGHEALVQQHFRDSYTEEENCSGAVVDLGGDPA